MILDNLLSILSFQFCKCNSKNYLNADIYIYIYI